MEDHRSIKYLCEICHKNPATEIKGGKYQDQRGTFVCCKQCKELIEDSRLPNAQ